MNVVSLVSQSFQVFNHVRALRGGKISTVHVSKKTLGEAFCLYNLEDTVKSLTDTFVTPEFQLEFGYWIAYAQGDHLYMTCVSVNPDQGNTLAEFVSNAVCTLVWEGNEDFGFKIEEFTESLGYPTMFKAKEDVIGKCYPVLTQLVETMLWARHGLLNSTQGGGEINVGLQKRGIPVRVLMYEETSIPPCDFGNMEISVRFICDLKAMRKPGTEWAGWCSTLTDVELVNELNPGDIETAIKNKILVPGVDVNVERSRCKSSLEVRITSLHPTHYQGTVVLE